MNRNITIEPLYSKNYTVQFKDKLFDLKLCPQSANWRAPVMFNREALKNISYMPLYPDYDMMETSYHRVAVGNVLVKYYVHSINIMCDETKEEDFYFLN